MADKKANKAKTENELIPQNNPSEEAIQKYVEQLGRYEGSSADLNATKTDVGEYLNQLGEYKGTPTPPLDVSGEQISKYVEGLGNYQGTPTPDLNIGKDKIAEYVDGLGNYQGTPVPQMNVGQDKISEYVDKLGGYEGSKNGSFEGTPVVHTNFKGAIDNEYINPNLVPVDILESASNMTPFRKQGSMVISPGLSDITSSLPTIPTDASYTAVDAHKFQVDRDNKEITLLVYKENSGSKVKMYITPYWNPASSFNNCNLGKTAESWVTDAWLELTEYYTTTLSSVPTNNTMVLTDVLVDTLHYFKGWFILNNNWTRTINNRYQYVTGYDNDAQIITTMGSLGYGDASKDWKANDSIELVRFPVRSHYGLNTEYIGNTNNFTALPTSYIGKLNELRIACGKDNRPLILTDIKERSYFSDSENVSIDYSSVASTSMVLSGEGYSTVPTVSFSSGSAAALTRVFPLVSQYTVTTAGTGYAVGDILQLKSGTPVGTNRALIRVDTIGGGGSISTISQYGDTTLYSAVPVFATATDWEYDNVTGSGSGAQIKFDWCVYELVLTNNGSGYSSAPTITISAPAADWGTKVTATAVAYLATNSSTTGDKIGMSYDGLWFDFASIPQTLVSSGVSAFDGNPSITANDVYLNVDCSITTYATTDCIKITPKIPGSWRILTSKKKSTVASPSPWQSPEYKAILTDAGQGVVAINHYYTPTYCGNIINHHIVFVKAVAEGGGTYDFANKTLAEMKTALETSVYTELIRSRFVFTVIGTSSTTFTAYDSTTTVNSEGIIQSTALGEEEIGLTASNNFLGTKVEVVSHGTTEPSGSTKKNTMLISCLIDNRSEILITQGTYEPAQGFSVVFSPWFSRRITGFNFYSKSVTSTLSGWQAYFSRINKYPYIKWLKKTGSDEAIYINETPLFASYSTKSMIGEDSAEFVNSLVIDKTNGYNCYKWSYQYNKFYTVFKQASPEYIDLEESGVGLKWIVNTNRYVDQDTTMNYTKAVFVGQTNGRYFISGCKNDVEYEELENDDIVFCNNYAVGVSQYDIFLRNSSLNVQLGDKDIIRAMSNYGGYLTVIKDSNSYVLDVNTDDELKYRVVDTMNGRGTTFGNSLGETPYGIVMPTYDGVWLMSPSGVTPIMNYSNSKFNLYKTLFASASNITTVYYNDYNEVMVCILTLDNTDTVCNVFTYNFTYKFWSTYAYTSDISVKKIFSDASRNVLMLDNKGGYTLWKVSETTNAFTWYATTHNMPYGDRFKQVYASWVTLLIDYTKEALTRSTIVLTPIKDGVEQTVITINVDNTLYLKPDGTFVTSSPGTHYIAISNSSSSIVRLRIILGASASILKSSASTYDITVVNTVTTLTEVINLINGMSTGLTISSGGTPSIIAFTGPATKQEATFMKTTYDDCLLDIPITYGTASNTFAVKVSGTYFTRFNLNGIYIWLNTSNRVPFLR